MVLTVHVSSRLSPFLESIIVALRKLYLGGIVAPIVSLSGSFFFSPNIKELPVTTLLLPFLIPLTRFHNCHSLLFALSWLSFGLISVFSPGVCPLSNFVNVKVDIYHI